MTEEQGSAQAVEQSDAGEILNPTDVRASDTFRKVVGNLSDENRALKAQLEEIQSKLAEDSKAKEIKAKEEAGRYEEVTAQLKAENAALTKKFEREMTTLKLENALVMAGADEYFSAWAKSNFPGGDIGEYVESLKADEKHSQRFNLGMNAPEKQPEPSGAYPASSNSTNWAQVKQDLQSRDPIVRDTADRKVWAFMEKHNKSPF